MNINISKDQAATIIQKSWKNYKTNRAFKKINTYSKINLPQQSKNNIEKLRSDICFKAENNNSDIKKSLALTLEEERFFNLFCELDFTFTHGTNPSYVDSIQNSQTIHSHDQLSRRKKNINGITASLDRETGNTDFVYGVLGSKESKFPDLLEDKADLFIFNVRRFLDKPFTVRLSDWYWYQTDRELDPCLLGSTLRRVVHAKPYKTYIYEHENGKTDRFTIKMGEEEFLGEAALPGLAMIMIKELRMIQKENPQFYENFFSLFSQEEKSESLELQKKGILHLFHLLYSAESSIPCDIKIGEENIDYTLSRGLSTKKQEIKELHEEIKNGRLDRVRYLINEDSSILDAREKNYGNTPLVEAIIQGKQEIVSYLLSKGANTELKIGPSKLTALMFAILQNKSEMVRMILQTRGVNVNAIVSPEDVTTPHPWKRYHNPLSLAAQVGDPEIIDLLIQAGARPRQQHVVIPIPTFINRADGVRYYLVGKKCYKNGYNLKAYGDYLLPGCLKNEVDGDPIEAAIRNLKFLTTIDASTLIRERKASTSLLHSYKKLSDDRGVEHQVDFVLIDFKKMDRVSTFGSSSPLHAESTNHLVNLHWAQLKKLDNLKASNAKVMEAVESPEKLDKEALNLLLYKEAEGVHLLHAAIRGGDVLEVLRLLDDENIDKEGKIDVYKDSSYKGRFTPLMTAISVKNKKIIKKLLKRGADPTIEVKGHTIFELVLADLFKKIGEDALTLLVRYTNKKLCINSDIVQKLIEFNRRDDVIQMVKNKNILFSGFDRLSENELSFFLKEENFNLLRQIIQSTKKDFDCFIFKISCLAASRNNVKVLNEIVSLGKPDKFLYHPSLHSSTNPLVQACKFNQTEAAILLIQNGFGRIGTKDINDKLPQDYVLENNNQEIMKELEKHSLFYTLFNRYGIMPVGISKHWILFSSKEDRLKFEEQLQLKSYQTRNKGQGKLFDIPLEILTDFLDGKLNIQSDFDIRLEKIEKANEAKKRKDKIRGNEYNIKSIEPSNNTSYLTPSMIIKKQLERIKIDRYNEFQRMVDKAKLKRV